MITVGEMQNTAMAMIAKSIELALHGDLEEALHAAEQALYCWDWILDTEPNNPEYQKSWRAVCFRIDELQKLIEAKAGLK